jgi:hypothetical protein
MTLNRIVFTLGLVFLFSIPSFAQKIKYKDLFVLLNAKQYDQAEPFLKKYLKDNQDNPNAFLFMGYMYEEKALMNDVLKEIEKQTTNTDSAVYFFDRAFKEIDERELRKNEEYYQAYSRRDLRTGKFGLKLSDVQFDLEKRIKTLKDRQQRIVLTNDKFKQLKLVYGHCEVLFKTIASRFKDQREFYLRSDESSMADLRKLGRKYDSCLISFTEFKLSMQSLGKTGYNQELDIQDINNFKHDGYAQPDFLADEIKIWDYKRWALGNLEIIEKEVKPIMEGLVKLDAELNGLREKLRKDSVAINPELAVITSKIKTMGLRKFDPSPMPEEVFNVKVSELEYGSGLAATKHIRDSSDLVLKQNLYKQQVKWLSKIDSSASLLLQRDLDYEVENYKGFVSNSYGSVSVLKSMIKSTGDFAVTEKAEKEKRIKNIEEVLNWVYDLSDSIPASTSVKSAKYFPITIVPNDHTYGLTFQDSTTFAYFYTITPTRKPTIKTSHKLDSGNFKKAKLASILGISTQDESKQTYFVIIYSDEKKADKTPTIIYQVSSAGLVWSKFYSLEGVPVEASFVKENGSLSLKVSTATGNKLVVIQKDGTQL